MSKARSKGTRGENLVVEFLREELGPQVERRVTAGRNDTGDVAGIPEVVIDDDEFYYADLDGAFCELCGRELECGQWGECDTCTGLDRCCDDLCYGAGRCMHR